MEFYPDIGILENVQSNGMYWNGMALEGIGLDRNEDWTGIERMALDWNELDLNLIGMECIGIYSIVGLDWISMEWIGLEWKRMDWNEMNWIGYRSGMEWTGMD